MLNIAMFTKAVLIVIVFHTNGETGTMMRQFDTIEECRGAAAEAMKAMTTIEEIKDGVALCSTRVKLLTDDNGKELGIEASLHR